MQLNRCKIISQIILCITMLYINAIIEYIDSIDFIESFLHAI